MPRATDCARQDISLAFNSVDEQPRWTGTYGAGYATRMRVASCLMSRQWELWRLRIQEPASAADVAIGIGSDRDREIASAHLEVAEITCHNSPSHTGLCRQADGKSDRGDRRHLCFHRGSDQDPLQARLTARKCWKVVKKRFREDLQVGWALGDGGLVVEAVLQGDGGDPLCLQSVTYSHPVLTSLKLC